MAFINHGQDWIDNHAEINSIVFLDLLDKIQRCKCLPFPNMLGNSGYKGNPFDIPATIPSPLFRKVQNLRAINQMIRFPSQKLPILERWRSAKAKQWWILDKGNQYRCRSPQYDTKRYIPKTSSIKNINFIYNSSYYEIHNYGGSFDRSKSSESSQTGSQGNSGQGQPASQSPPIRQGHFISHLS